MTVWRLVQSGVGAGAMNMAIDEVLLNSVAAGVSQPVLRLYGWSPATLSLGYAQSIHSDIDFNFCQQSGIDIVRRATGGRAVLHDKEMTYAVIAPTNLDCFGRSILECYRALAEVLQHTLNLAGLSAQLVPGEHQGGHSNPSRAICFSAPSQYELVIGGRKVAGSAQKRKGAAFLQHGSVPIELDLTVLGRILKIKTGQDRAGLEKVGWLNFWLEKPLTKTKLEGFLIEAFQRHLSIEFVHSSLTKEELTEAAELRNEKYAHSNWTFSR
ncbi:MAG: lipoate--protein ligase family protein [Deltaproteobacteria bacterium]|jgi:lipoate-protein ligase A|nr:lipoate--protein ligase family protein [Deltaproteobacteria bacterium]